PGQRVRGAAVADGQVRGHLPVAVRGGAPVAARAGPVLPVLQRGTSPSSLGLPDAGGGVPGGPSEGEVGGVRGRHSFSPRPPSAPVKGGRGENECPGVGPTGSDVGERSSPGL